MNVSKAHMSDETALAGLKLADLKAQCKEKNLPVSGTKAELIARLLGTAPPAKKPKVAAKTQKPVLEKPVFQTLMNSREPILIKRNVYGHFEHPETHLVFSMQKKVIGTQLEGNPEVQPLMTKDLENVYKYHFQLDENAVVQDQKSGDVATDNENEERLQELLHLTVPELAPKLIRQDAEIYEIDADE